MPTENQSFTILGAGGFIGAAVAARLGSLGCRIHAVTRASLPNLFATRRNAGHVIDCVGLTGDFRVRMFDAAEAHVGLVARCLVDLRFDSFMLLSSTRVYARATSTQEDAALPTRPADPSDLYNLTKLTGEALCLTDPRPTIRVVRLSNIYGAGIPAETFLGQVLAEGASSGSVLFRQSPWSAKDYVSLDAVTRVLPALAADGRDRLYNLAAGHNTSHAAIAEHLHAITGWRTSFAPDAPTVCNVPIDATRIAEEFGAIACDLLTDLPALIPPELEEQCSPSTSHLVA
jgi:nucleoside-diphosphate-sugar epimerase